MPVRDPGGRIVRLLRTVGRVTLGVAAVPNAVVASYLGVVTIAAIVRRQSVGSEEAAEAATLRCQVFVPAHDEAGVIGPTVEALVAQDHPTELFDVHVVADNCTDSTARLAAAAGARVHERVAPDSPGKGPALNWLLGRVEGDADDVIVVVDADTIATPGFLRAVVDEMGRGAEVVQGRYGVLDADASSETALRWAALAVRHHLRPLGRRALGLSCGLFGNGMAFRRSVLEAHPWTAHLTEDAEMGLSLLLDGIPVRYAPDAVVEAEMPTSLAASESQHQRWELGRAQVTRKFVPRLLRRTLSPRRVTTRVTRPATLDAVLDQMLPPLSVLVAAQVAVAAGSLPTRSHLLRACSWLPLAVTIAHVGAALRVAHAPSSVYRALLGTPRLVVWKLWLLAQMTVGARSTTWERTQRNTE